MKRKLVALAEPAPPTPSASASHHSDLPKRPRPSPSSDHGGRAYVAPSRIESWLSSIPSPASPTLPSPPGDAMASKTAADATPSLPPSLPPSSRRSSSPSRSNKWPNETLYRHQNLHLANVDFTHMDDAPDHVRRAVSAVKQEAAGEEGLKMLAETVLGLFYTRARRLESDSGNEADWRTELESLLKNVIDSGKWDAELKVATERDWSRELKPDPYVVDIPLLVPQKRQLEAAHNPPAGGQLPPASAMTKRSLDLRTPRPDIFVGFSDRAFSRRANTVLYQLQANGSLVSDPTLAAGARFPFLIVEAKSGATGGTLYQAQNQAAIGGVCMLNSLLRLDDLSSSDDAPPAADSLALSHAMPVAFSIATQSSVMELWVHYRSDPTDDSTPHTYCMAKVATFDCAVDRDSCAQFLRTLIAVLQWGSREVNRWCSERLDRVALKLNR